MGARSKSTSSLKSATPIPLPHDGPIFHCANNGGTHKDDTSSLARAVQLLVNSNHEVSSTSKLCQSLQGAQTAKEQLHALQSYRCTLLNNKKKSGSELEQVLDEDSSIALYRLLLEWSGSSSLKYWGSSGYNDITCTTFLNTVSYAGPGINKVVENCSSVSGSWYWYVKFPGFGD